MFDVRAALNPHSSLWKNGFLKSSRRCIKWSMSEFTTEDGYCSSFAAHQSDFDGEPRQQTDLHRSTLRCFRKARNSDVREQGKRGIVELVRPEKSSRLCTIHFAHIVCTRRFKNIWPRISRVTMYAKFKTPSSLTLIQVLLTFLINHKLVFTLKRVNVK